MREAWKVRHCDAVDLLGSLGDGEADLLLCSPPYQQARTYLENGVDLGIARGPEEWVAWMVTVCQAARHACKGLCALVVEGQTKGYRYSCTPFLLMADLHRAGFHLRKPAAYKRNGICGSGGPDWLRNDWEPVVCFTRGGRLPWSDPTACGHPPKFGPGGAMSNRHADGRRANARASARVKERYGWGTSGHPNGDLAKHQRYKPPELANPGNFIDCTAPDVIDCGAAGGANIGNNLAHENEAPFPEDLAAFFVLSFCPPGGLVVDCFAGSGTTGAVARRHGRRFLGCDLRESQVELSRRRIAAETPTLFAPRAEAPPAPDGPAQRSLFGGET